MALAQKTALVNTVDDVYINFFDCFFKSVVKWLSCNGDALGVGPTMVFASAAAMFLYHELEKAVGVTGDNHQVSLMEKTLVFTMVSGMLALMIHIWVCATRFFQYYLDTLIKDSPNLLLEMTTAGIFKGQSEFILLTPLIKFLRQQQPQIHITTCWFLALCYADYVRKRYCDRFNLPYLEQWQMDLHERATQGLKNTVQKVNSLVGAVHQRLRGLSQPLLNGPPRTDDYRSASTSISQSSASSYYTLESDVCSQQTQSENFSYIPSQQQRQKENVPSSVRRRNTQIENIQIEDINKIIEDLRRKYSISNTTTQGPNQKENLTNPEPQRATQNENMSNVTLQELNEIENIANLAPQRQNLNRNVPSSEQHRSNQNANISNLALNQNENKANLATQKPKQNQNIPKLELQRQNQNSSNLALQEPNQNGTVANMASQTLNQNVPNSELQSPNPNATEATPAAQRQKKDNKNMYI